MRGYSDWVPRKIVLLSANLLRRELLFRDALFTWGRGEPTAVMSTSFLGFPLTWL
jgi:hypothetical protein